MKTKEELFALRNEVELLNTKLCELSDDELAQVTGGIRDFSKLDSRITQPGELASRIKSGYIEEAGAYLD